MSNMLWNLICYHPEITIIGAITLIQITPIKVNPWSAIARAIKKLLIGSLESKIDTITEKVNHLEEQVNEDKALQARTHILRFASEIYEQKHHSKEYFEDVIDEIDMYEKYCNEHPDFKNNKTVMSAGLIKETYKKVFTEHRF